MTESVEAPELGYANIEVPESWEKIKFSDAFAVIPTTNRKINQKDYLLEGKIPVVDQGEGLIGGFTNNDDLKIKVSNPLIGFGDHTRRFKLIDFDFVAGADGLKILDSSYCEIRYAYYACRSLRFPEKGYARHFSHLKKADFPVAPEAEQIRIADKLDELFSQIEKGEENLRRVQTLVKQYRQSVLKAAVTGELTRDWRAKHGTGGETGEQLLARILDARRAAWEAAELEKIKAKGKPPKDDKWKAKYKEPVAPDTTDLPDLPEGWVWATMDHISEIAGGVTVDSRRKVENGRTVPYLRVANVQRGYLDLSEVKEIHVSTDVIEKLRLQQGDILFNEGGDLDKLGRGWIWNCELEQCIHQNHVFRARLVASDLPSKFVSFFANALGQTYFMGEGKQTTNLASISLTKLRAFPIPIPPTAEAEKAVEYAESALSNCDAIEQRLDQSTGYATALRQSVLQAAFSGRLVPQDPTDEPASVLLERIAEERAAYEAAKPKRTRKPQRKSKKKQKAD